MTAEIAGFHRVPIPELPLRLTRQAHEHIRRFAVTLIVGVDDVTMARPCAGTFVRMNGRPGILTAQHVWKEALKAKKLAMMVGGPMSLEVRLHEAFTTPASHQLSPFEARVPDVAFIPLAVSQVAAIEARGKAFYSIDKRMADKAFDLLEDEGFWVTVGSPVALLRRDERAVGSLVYDTAIECRLELCGWDYIIVNMNCESNPAIPQDFEGMSGGGLWRVKFAIDSERSEFTITNPSRDIVLSGLIFYQTDAPGRQLIAHGPKSLYRVFPEWQSAEKAG